MGNIMASLKRKKKTSRVIISMNNYEDEQKIDDEILDLDKPGKHIGNSDSASINTIFSRDGIYHNKN
jgi:hypothetical protein